MKIKQRKLLDAIGQAQDLFGAIRASMMDDRQKERSENIERLSTKGFDLCVRVLGEFPVPAPSQAAPEKGEVER